MFKAVIALSLLLGILAGVAAFIRKMLRDKALHEERMAQLVREDYQDRYMASIADTSLSLSGAAQLRIENDDDDDVSVDDEITQCDLVVKRGFALLASNAEEERDLGAAQLLREAQQGFGS